LNGKTTVGTAKKGRKKENRGGFRPGAGRKPEFPGEEMLQCTIYLPRSHYEFVLDNESTVQEFVRKFVQACIDSGLQADKK